MRNSFPVVRRLIVVLAFIVIVPCTGCSTAPRTEQARLDIQQDAAQALERARVNDPSLARLMDDSVGYAVFPSVGKGGAGIGGAYGRGVLYEGGKAVGFCDLSQASVGFQLGGQAFTQIMVFDRRTALADFKAGRFAFDATATAVALDAGAAANAQFINGVAVFTMNQAGLMYQATVGGQRFTYEPM